jgi:DinB superfamily
MAAGRWNELNRRVTAMHSLWRRAIADLTLDQVNHHERQGVLPIAFSLMHYVNNEDRYVTERIVGGSQLWETENWPARVGGNVPQVRRGTPLALAEGVRFGDLETWRAYQAAVFARTEAALAGLSEERFEEVVFPRVPEAMRGGFLSKLAGDGPVRLGDMMDVVLYQHGMRHLGEVEHARSLVGLGGLD